MNFADLLKSINEYAREYIDYLARIFDRSHPFRPAAHLSDSDGHLLIHAVISLTLGIYMQQVIVGGVMPSDMTAAQASAAIPDYGYVLKTFARISGFWIFLALAIRTMTFGGGARTDFSSALSLVLRVFPPIFVIGTSTTLFVSSAFYAFFPSAMPENCRDLTGIVCDLTAQWFLIVITLPDALSQGTSFSNPTIPAEKPWLRRIIVGMTLVVVIFSNLVTVGPKNLVQNECLAPRHGSGANLGKFTAMQFGKGISQ